MGEISYKQLHQFHCGASAFPERSSSVSICPHGFFVSVSDCGLLLYDTKHYLEATGTCKLRRDKPLPDHRPNIVVSSVDPIVWTAFNSDGLILAVLTSSESRGTLVNLLNVVDLVKSGSTDLANISRSIRVCGGETNLWKLRDFAWSPTDPTTFVVVLDSGAVRLFNFPPDGSRSFTLVGQLPGTADCRCVSWSPKGKQLAICLNGSLSTVNGIVQGPLILQVDPQLQQKRIVPLSQLFNSNNDWKNSLPVDLLWTSSYNFLLAIKQSVNEAHAICSTNVLYISTTSKSPKPSAVAIDNLSSRIHYDKVQYYFRFLGPNHVIVTLGCIGEEIIVLRLPTTPGSIPQEVVSIELPADGYAMSVDVGVLQNITNESVDNNAFLLYLLTYLSNGNICPYILNSNDQLNLSNSTNVKLIHLPIPKPVIVATSDSNNLSLNTPKPASMSVSFANDHSTHQIKQNLNTLSVNFANQQQHQQQQQYHHVSNVLPVNTTICITTTTTTTISSSPGSLQSMPSSISLNNSNKISTESKLSIALHNNTNTNNSFKHIDTAHTTSVPMTKENNFNHPCKTSTDYSRDLPLPKSVQVAAAHFTSALQLEAEAGRTAWRNLFNLFISGTIDGKSGESVGLDIVEARLCNVDRFFKAMDEVIAELTNALNERKEDLTNSISFGERLRRALRLYANGDWFHTITGHLDPEMNRLFSQLKRRARLAEAGLYDLENQIESLSTELNTTTGQSKNTPPPPRPTTTTTLLLSSSPNRQAKENLSAKKGITNDSNIMRTIDTNANLIRTERGRIDFIMENLKRLGLTPLKSNNNNNIIKCEKTKSKHQSQCKTLHSSLIKHDHVINASGDYNVVDDDEDDETSELLNPYRTMLMERDQALLRLFSNYKLPVIYSCKVCPSISHEEEDADDIVNDQCQSSSSSSFANVLQSTNGNRSQMKTGASPGNLKNSKLEQLLVVSGEIAADTSVSCVPKTPPKSSAEKSVNVVNKTETVPSTPLSSKTPTSVINSSSKLSDMTFNLARNQTPSNSTVSSTVNSTPISNVTTSLHQSFSLGIKPMQQLLFTQPNITSVPQASTISSTANINNGSDLSSLFKSQSPSSSSTSSSLPTMSTPNSITSAAHSSAPSVINNPKVSSPVFQKVEPNVTATTTTSIVAPVTTVSGGTSFINSNPPSALTAANSLFNSPVISKPAFTNTSNASNNTPSSGTEINEIQKGNHVSNISSISSPQITTTTTTSVTSKPSSGLFSFLPTPVCSSSGVMFGSGQNQNQSNTSVTTTTTTMSSLSNSLFTGLPPLNTTSTTTTTTSTDSNSQSTKSNVTFNSKPLFCAPNLVVSTPTNASSTDNTSGNIFLFGNPTQLSSTMSTGATTTVSSTTSVGFPSISNNETFNKTPSAISAAPSIFGSTTSSTPVSVSAAPSIFGATVFGKATTPNSGLFSSLQNTTSSSSNLPPAPGTVGLFSFSTPATTTSNLNSTATTTTTTTTTTSATLNFSSPFGSSSVFAGNSATTPVQSLFQNTTLANAAATTTSTTTPAVSSSVGLFGTLANNASSASGNKLFSSQPTTQTAGGFLFGSPFNTSVSSGTSNLFQVNTATTATTTSAAAAATTVSSSTLFGTGLFNTSLLGNKNNTTTSSAQTTNSSPFSFVSGTPSLFGGVSITSSQVNSTAPGTGLFASATGNSTGGGGLFGSPMGSDTKSVNSLFSVSNLNLGGNATPQNPTQNAFGKPFGSTTFGNQANPPTLFGSPASVSQNNIIPSGTSPSAPSSSSNPQSGLFSSSILGSSSLFNSPTPASSTLSGGGGLFSNLGGGTQVNTGTSLFATQTSPTGGTAAIGGFGSSPTFGSPAFNKPINTNPTGQGLFGMSGSGAFNSTGGLFGSTAPIVGVSLFGGGGGDTKSSPVGGGLFAALGNKSDNLSFGSLAQNSPPGGNIPASPFGTSPSFTQRRA
ncbi:unnamed protein product [Schistosoma turkestanicum]|nr:unnamed protein product [Schistosoma turkestanicum]